MTSDISIVTSSKSRVGSDDQEMKVVLTVLVKDKLNFEPFVRTKILHSKIYT